MNGIAKPIPGNYAAEIAVCRYMGGWSQADYDTADAAFVDEIETRIAAESHWHAERAKLDGSQ